MDKFERFNETELPPAKEFYSRLNDSNVDEKIMNMHKKYGVTLTLKIWVNIMIYT